MNVKELKELLENYDDDVPVVLNHRDYAGYKYYEVNNANSEEGVDKGGYWREPKMDATTSDELVVLS